MQSTVKALQFIYHKYQIYDISLDKAQRLAEPHLEKINKRAVEIASKYNQEPQTYKFRDIPKLKS